MDLLGDQVSTALSSVGVTPERISSWLGAPCYCDERREKLNRLDAWARRVVKGKTDKAKEFLITILNDY